jgi:hypothetical protein
MRNRFVALAVLSVGIASLLPERAHAAGPFQYYAVTPCRVVDTRTTSGAPENTTSTPIPQATETKFTMQTQCGIPTGATAVTVNATVVSPTRAGYLTLWPTGGAFPGVSTLNYNAGEPALANGAIVPLGASTPDLSVAIGMQGPGSAHVIIDVTGYFK